MSNKEYKGRSWKPLREGLSEDGIEPVTAATYVRGQWFTADINESEIYVEHTSYPSMPLTVEGAKDLLSVLTEAVEFHATYFDGT